METLELTQKKHHAILQTLRQVESILAPLHTGEGKNDLLNFNIFNIERLAKNTDLLNSEFCTVNIITEGQRLHPDHPRHTEKPDFELGAPVYDDGKVLIEIAGPDFGYSFAPQMVCEIQKRLNTKFKQAESETKKAAKATRQMKPSAPAKEPVKQLAKVLINKPAELKNNSKGTVNRQYKYYLCNGMKRVDLIIKTEYLKQIVAGIKKREYRTLSRYNGQLLGEKNPADGLLYPRKDINQIRFLAGYHKDRKYAIVEVEKIQHEIFDKYIPEGMKPGTHVLTIYIRQVIEHNF